MPATAMQYSLLMQKTEQVMSLPRIADVVPCIADVVNTLKYNSL